MTTETNVRPRAGTRRRRPAAAARPPEPAKTPEPELAAEAAPEAYLPAGDPRRPPQPSPLPQPIVTLGLPEPPVSRVCALCMSRVALSQMQEWMPGSYVCNDEAGCQARSDASGIYPQSEDELATTMPIAHGQVDIASQAIARYEREKALADAEARKTRETRKATVITS